MVLTSHYSLKNKPIDKINNWMYILKLLDFIHKCDYDQIRRENLIYFQKISHWPSEKIWSMK